MLVTSVRIWEVSEAAQLLLLVTVSLYRISFHHCPSIARTAVMAVGANCGATHLMEDMKCTELVPVFPIQYTHEPEAPVGVR